MHFYVKRGYVAPRATAGSTFILIHTAADKPFSFLRWTATIALTALIFLNSYPTRVHGASCCQQTSTRRSLGSSDGKSSAQQQQQPAKRSTALLDELNELDREYKLYLTNSILHNFRVQNVPQQAADWRKKSKSIANQAGEHIDNDEQLLEDDDDSDNDVIRRYTLEVVGRIPDGNKEVHRIRQKRHRHHQHHNGQQHRENKKECVITYEFNVTLINELNAEFETLIDKAEFLLPDHRRSAAGGGGRFLLYGTDLLLNTQEEDQRGRREESEWSAAEAAGSATVTADRPGTIAFDVTDSLAPLWSTYDGANLTGAWVSRRACRLVAHHHNGRGVVEAAAAASSDVIVVADAGDDSADGEFAPTLRLHLKEKLRRRRERQQSQRTRQHAIKRQTAERMLTRLPTSQSQNDEASARKENRQHKIAASHNHNHPQQHSSRNKVPGGSSGSSIVIDCDEQWDASFFRTFNDSEYDALMPCCRRKVKINFADLGWDQWVLSPRSFDAYYCIGRCSTFGVGGSGGSPNLDGSDAGAAFYAEMMNMQRRGGNRLSPCCSPTKFAPLTIKVLSGVNEEATQTLDNLIVRQCGCM